MAIEVRLHDGSLLTAEVSGEGPAVLLPVNPKPVEGPQADELRKWGADPALGRRLADGLAGAFRVVAFDYEGHVLAVPKPDTLTPDNVAADLLAVADAAGADRFAYYGYSWLAMAGQQLALRTDRLTALAMGGYPPVDAPVAELLRVTTANHELAVDPRPAAEGGTDWDTVPMTLTERQTRQFVTLYRSLTAAGDVTGPRLCFVGADDRIDYGERWGGVRVDLAAPVVAHRRELEAAGWRVHVLDGLDHMTAMQADVVLPILEPWLREVSQ